MRYKIKRAKERQNERYTTCDLWRACPENCCVFKFVVFKSKDFLASQAFLKFYRFTILSMFLTGDVAAKTKS